MNNLFSTLSFRVGFLSTIAVSVLLSAPVTAKVTVSTVHTFVYAKNQPFEPAAGVAQGSDGTFYGTTTSGGADGRGSIYRLSPGKTGYTEHLVYSFSGGADGSAPAGSLALSGTTLYGTCSGGEGSSQYGTIFAYSLTLHQLATLHTFAGTGDGANPTCGLLVDGGNLYGVTPAGGYNNGGGAFAIATTGFGYTVLHTFDSNTDGTGPNTDLVLGADGALYGATGGNSIGGVYQSDTLYRLTLDGSTFQVLHQFDPTSSDGLAPGVGHLVDIGGVLYGTTLTGGADNYGTLFSIKEDDTSYAVLANFNGPKNGDMPVNSLIDAGNGKLLGTSQGGGTVDAGKIFRFDTGTGKLTTVYTFTGLSDGANPLEIYKARNGKVWGVTSTTVYECTP